MGTAGRRGRASSRATQAEGDHIIFKIRDFHLSVSWGIDLIWKSLRINQRMEAPERGADCRAHVGRAKVGTGDKRPRKSQQRTRAESPAHGGEQVCTGKPPGNRRQLR